MRHAGPRRQEGWRAPPSAGPPRGTGTGVIDAGATPTVPGLVLDAELGVGTFGVVWRAVDLGTGEPVAVRLGTAAGGAEAVAREGALLRRLRHENLVGLRSVVDLPDGVRALVLDLAPAGSLADLVDRRGAVPPGQVVTVAVGVAHALQHVHAQGLVHGRLTMRDVLFDVTGRPLVSDVGVASLLAPDRALDDTGGASPAPADDVLALGELLREALTGGAAGGVAGPLAELVEACLEDAPSRPTPERVAQLARRLVTPEPVDLTAAPAPAASPRPGWRPLPGRPAAGHAVPPTHLPRPLPASSSPSRRPAGGPGAAATAADTADVPADAGDGERRRGPRVAAAAAVVVAGVGLTAGALALALRTDGPAGPAPAAAGGPGPTQNSPAPSPSGPGASAPAVPADVTAVVRGLAAARAAALSSASESALARVDAPGSAALAQDVALVRRLDTAGVRLEGLRFTVSGVRLVAATAEGVTVEAGVATSAHRQVRADGTVERSVAALPARRVQLTLVRVGGQWRVSRAL